MSTAPRRQGNKEILRSKAPKFMLKMNAVIQSEIKIRLRQNFRPLCRSRKPRTHLRSMYISISTKKKNWDFIFTACNLSRDSRLSKLMCKYMQVKFTYIHTYLPSSKFLVKFELNFFLNSGRFFVTIGLFRFFWLTSSSNTKN
jgi:hypothetical protein